MSWLLFIDESGHDRKKLPYEVRGGIAIHASKLNSAILTTKDAISTLYGGQFLEKGEIKGSGLLKPKNFAHAKNLDHTFSAERVKQLTVDLLTDPIANSKMQNIAAYGNSSICLAKESFGILQKHNAKLFCTIVSKNSPLILENGLRMDFIKLIEKFSQFLEKQNEYGVLVMDQVENSQDKKLSNCIEELFRQQRSKFRKVVSAPIFVSSDLTLGVQLADLCIYAVNNGAFKPKNLPYPGLNATTRKDIENLSSLIRPLVIQERNWASTFYWSEFK